MRYHVILIILQVLPNCSMEGRESLKVCNVETIKYFMSVLKVQDLLVEVETKCVTGIGTLCCRHK